MACVVLASWACAQERSPFTDMRFEGERVFVVVDDVWHELASIEGVDTDDLVKCARQVDESQWRKRVAEDLVRVLRTCGQSPGATVDLTLIGEDGQRVTLADVAMTEENRRLVYHRWQLHEPFDADAAFASLVEVIRREHAYAMLKGLDLEGMAQQAAARSTTRLEAMLEAQKIICRLGDGHASLSDWREAVPKGDLPFVLWQVEGGVMAFIDDGHPRLVAEGFPFLVSMDGVAIERWMEAAQAYVPDGSTALKQRWSLFALTSVNLVRDELGLKLGETIDLELATPDGRTTNVTMRLGAQRLMPPYRPIADEALLEKSYEVRRLEGGIGYVRILRMVDDATAIRDAVLGMLDAPGLVIDVRSNGGGNRDPIRQLLPLVLKEQARVVNVAARRIQEGDAEPEEGWLARRYMRPTDWEGWTPAERAAVDDVMAAFVPEWSPPEGEFSAWQAMVVSRGDARFEGPVVVLMDSWCFSATDIFLGAFKGVEGVTLMGETSGGGSAYSGRFSVEGLGSVRLARMASFLPDGSLYDGNGIRPDVEMTYTVDDVLGRTDSMLDAAVELIRSR